MKLITLRSERDSLPTTKQPWLNSKGNQINQQHKWGFFIVEHKKLLAEMAKELNNSEERHNLRSN